MHHIFDKIPTKADTLACFLFWFIMCPDYSFTACDAFADVVCDGAGDAQSDGAHDQCGEHGHKDQLEHLWNDLIEELVHVFQHQHGQDDRNAAGCVLDKGEGQAEQAHRGSALGQTGGHGGVQHKACAHQSQRRVRLEPLCCRPSQQLNITYFYMHIRSSPALSFTVCGTPVPPIS